MVGKCASYETGALRPPQDEERGIEDRGGKGRGDGGDGPSRASAGDGPSGQTAARAWSMSAMRSRLSSMPMEMRTRSPVMP